LRRGGGNRGTTSGQKSSEVTTIKKKDKSKSENEPARRDSGPTKPKGSRIREGRRGALSSAKKMMETNTAS